MFWARHILPPDTSEARSPIRWNWPSSSDCKLLASVTSPYVSTVKKEEYEVGRTIWLI